MSIDFCVFWINDSVHVMCMLLSPGGIICVLGITDVLKTLQDKAEISCTWDDFSRKRILS